MAGWAAFERWTPHYLRSTAGDREVVVRETHGPPRNIFQNLAEGGSAPFGDYLDWVLDTARDVEDLAGDVDDPGEITRRLSTAGLEVSYYLDAKLALLSDVLLRDTSVPNWYRRPPLDVNFWCGVLGTSSGLHCDVTPNCNVQVVGTKHFTLFPPKDAERISRVRRGTHCRFDPNMPDFDRFPLAREATGWECALRPGESLYIPVGWFHQVTVTSPWAVNVNFFWKRPFPQGIAAPHLWHFLLRRGRARVGRALSRAR